MEGIIILVFVLIGSVFLITALRGGSLIENVRDLFGVGGGRSGGSF